MLKKTILSFICLTCAQLENAIEPLKDRAVVQRMNAELLLPDSSTIKVDVNFDCGSDYKDTALIIMNDAGAKLIAASYSKLYGAKYGQKIIDAWENKKAPSAPRKPTYLFIIAHRDKDIDWNKKDGQGFNNSNQHVNIAQSFEHHEEAPALNDFVPQVIAGCGVRDDHDPNEARSLH